MHITYRTGLKCLPYSRLVKTGDQLNDSHAEIIARRGFIK
jgi:tRNA-specific adenosine deaminase 1